jgi:hypothetical protein
LNGKTINSELQEDIDKIDIDCVRVVTDDDDDDDDILIEQKGKYMFKDIELILETVERQSNIQDIIWEKGLIYGSDMEQIVDVFWKQLSELTKRHSILQGRLEELKQAAFKRKRVFQVGRSKPNWKMNYNRSKSEIWKRKHVKWLNRLRLKIMRMFYCRLNS